jgi:DNA polymerase-4
MNRTIIHFDLDAFFCAVEEILSPDLKGKAFAVGGLPSQRGVVSSCSYAARRFGVHSAMPMARAILTCPGLVIQKPNFKAYSRYSKNVMSLAKTYSDIFEQISIDEAFLDVSLINDGGIAIAREIQARIKKEYDLPTSFGVATNKLVAKIATDTGKSKNKTLTYPYAITEVKPGEEAAFLAPLPVKAMMGIGPKTASRLENLGIHTLGELAQLPEIDLVNKFGKFGHELFLRSKGIDDSPIYTSHELKSVSNETTFPRDVRERETLLITLDELTHSVSRRLKDAHARGSTIRLKIRWADFSTITRQATLDFVTDDFDVIYPKVCDLFLKCWDNKTPVRLIGVGVSNFSSRHNQLSLWEIDQKPKTGKEEILEKAIRDIEERFGSKIIRRGQNPIDQE